MLSLLLGAQLAGNRAIAQTPEQKCNIALKACGKVIEDYKNILNKQSEMLEHKNAEIASLKAETSGILNNKWFWLVVGIGAGAATIAIIRR